MKTSTRQEYKDLTAEHLFDLLSSLPEDVEADPALAKRKTCRWLLRAPAELHYTTPEGTEGVQFASIRDICITGTGLQCKDPVPVDTVGELILPLEDGDYKIGIRIAHCTQTIGGWKIGCQLLLPGAVQLVPMVNQAAQIDQETFERNGR